MRVSFEVWDSERAFLTKDLPEFLISRDQTGAVKLKPLLESLKKHYNLLTSEDSHSISYFNEQY